jgi:hypothetical protein
MDRLAQDVDIPILIQCAIHDSKEADTLSSKTSLNHYRMNYILGCEDYMLQKQAFSLYSKDSSKFIIAKKAEARLI